MGGGPPGAPLSARSILLSVLLGSHPPQLPARALVRVGDLLGVSEGAVRVALSRMVADGELESSGSRYRLAGRLAERQAALDRGRQPPLRPWRGAWELAAITSDDAAATGALAASLTASLTAALTTAGLAPLRPGVWLRPDNLDRPWPAELSARTLRIVGRVDGDDAALAGSLWDLAGWQAEADRIVEQLSAAADPAGRFALAAAAARHLRADPLLPPALLPTGWPGDRLRRAYRRYEAELAGLIRSAVDASGG